MEDTTKIISVVRGASNVEIQAIFRALAEKWLPDVRLAGLVAENHGLAGRHCQAAYLRNLTTGARYSIFHDLSPGIAMCHVDAAITAGLPLLTSVSPAHDEAWRRFVVREFAVLPADPAAIDLWRHAVRTRIRHGDRVERLAL